MIPLSGTYDVFLSHHSDSSKQLVEEIGKKLKDLGVTPWYAESNIGGSQNFSEEIPIAIQNSRLFVLLLNKYANESVHVIKEVNLALKKPMLIIRLDDCEPSGTILYASSNSQMVTVDLRNGAMAVQQICEEILSGLCKLDGGVETVSKEGYKTSWEGNDLAFYGDEGERGRISQQNHFVYDFAGETYHTLLSEMGEGVFLDIGCNTGTQAMMYLEDHPAIRYVGIDREEEALQKGREQYPNATFFRADCEDDDFGAILSDIEDELNIDGFDIINVSMMLLHTINPAALLDVLSDHLADGGRLIVLDIDDGFNVAFPDPGFVFKKAIDLCFETEYSGFRHCGRMVYKMLHDVDMRTVTLHKVGYSTVGMDRKQKESFFDVYFWFVLDDLRKMHAEAPNSKFIKSDLDWMEAHYKEMRMAFKKKDFFFTLGFVLFSATKE